MLCEFFVFFSCVLAVPSSHVAVACLPGSEIRERHVRVELVWDAPDR
jgi:hypothetical protein